MKKTKVRILLFFALLFLSSSMSSYAQADEGSTEPGAEPPPGPISQALPLLALLGIGFAYKAFAKAE